MVRKLVNKTDNINELISKGAPVCEDMKKNIESWVMINLRIPSWMIQEIDFLMKSRIGMSRNAWLLEAISDKMKKETGE
jgi:hypothetical protein